MKKFPKYFIGIIGVLLIFSVAMLYVYAVYLRHEPGFTVSGSPELLRDTQINVHIYRYDVTENIYNVPQREIKTLLKNGEVRNISPMMGDIYDIYVLNNGKVGHIQIAKEVYGKIPANRLSAKNEIVLSEKNGSIRADFVPFKLGGSVRGVNIDTPLDQFVAQSKISNRWDSFVKLNNKSELKQYIAGEF